MELELVDVLLDSVVLLDVGSSVVDVEVAVSSSSVAAIEVTAGMADIVGKTTAAEVRASGVYKPLLKVSVGLSGAGCTGVICTAGSVSGAPACGTI